MRTSQFLTLGGLLLAALSWTALASAEEPAAKDAAKPAAGEKLVPLPIKLPRALFVGTPKDIKARPTLEPYTEKPRPPYLAPEGVTNLALNKPVTSSDPAPIIGELNLVTDGDRDGSEGSFVELGPDVQWVQIDLGKPAEIYAVLVWHYHAEGRVYHSVIAQVSDDPEFAKDTKTIFNNDFDNSAKLGAGKDLEYIDDNRGKLLPAKDAQGGPVRGRYVRLYSRGNTTNDMNHYVEVEVYGK